MTAPPSPDPQPTGIQCVNCGYDLSGTAVGAACPECGTPVAESLRPRLQPQAAGDNSNATAALVLGILSLACCALLGPLAWVLGHRVIKDAPTAGYSPGTVTTARVGMILGIIGTCLLVIGALSQMLLR